MHFKVDWMPSPTPSLLILKPNLTQSIEEHPILYPVFRHPTILQAVVDAIAKTGQALFKEFVPNDDLRVYRPLDYFLGIPSAKDFGQPLIADLDPFRLNGAFARKNKRG
jgi:hypothetical protein